MKKNKKSILSKKNRKTIINALVIWLLINANLVAPPPAPPTQGLYISGGQ